jgi:hypothetical protein
MTECAIIGQYFVRIAQILFGIASGVDSDAGENVMGIDGTYGRHA